MIGYNHLSKKKKNQEPDKPRAMPNPTLFNNHRHNSILIRLSPFLMHPYNLVYPNIAH